MNFFQFLSSNTKTKNFLFLFHSFAAQRLDFITKMSTSFSFFHFFQFFFVIKFVKSCIIIIAILYIFPYTQLYEQERKFHFHFLIFFCISPSDDRYTRLQLHLIMLVAVEMNFIIFITKLVFGVNFNFTSFHSCLHSFMLH